jgi:hypothetical protein
MSKYGAVRTKYNGRTYASKKEARRAAELDALMRADDGVSHVLPQPDFQCIVNGRKVCTYVADFKVWWKDGRITYEDVKGMKTPVYRLKKKLVEALFNITIEEH